MGNKVGSRNQMQGSKGWDSVTQTWQLCLHPGLGRVRGRGDEIRRHYEKALGLAWGQAEC